MKFDRDQKQIFFSNYMQHLTQHFISGHTHNPVKIDIYSFSRHCLTIVTFCLLNHQFLFKLYATVTFYHLKHVAAQPDSDREMLAVMSDEMVDAFDKGFMDIDVMTLHYSSQILFIFFY